MSHSGLQRSPTLNSALLPPCRSPAGAPALFRRGVLAADGGLLERGPLPEAPARHRGAQPAKHHGADVQLRLQAEEQQPGGLKLKKTSKQAKSDNTPTS